MADEQDVSVAKQRDRQGRVIFLEGFSPEAKAILQTEARVRQTSLARYIIGILAGMTSEDRALAYAEGQAQIAQRMASGKSRDDATVEAMGGEAATSEPEEPVAAHG